MAVIDTAPGSSAPVPAAHVFAITKFPFNAKAVTKSDADTFSHPVAIFVGTGGTVTVTPAGGQADVQYTIPTGGFVPVLVTAVKATGTAASGLVAQW